MTEAAPSVVTVGRRHHPRTRGLMPAPACVKFRKMNPRLVAVAGPFKGVTYPLHAAEEFAIGRDSSNQLAISDGVLSRRHCSIRNEDGQCKITDLHSSNGTFVNGLPVDEKILEHGDRISAGESRFVFLFGEDDAPLAADTVRLDEQSFVAGSTIRLRVEDALYLRPEEMITSLPPLARMARDLSLLLKISTTINSIRDPLSLQRQLLEMIFEVVPAECGAIILVGGEPHRLLSIFGLRRPPGEDGSVQVSRTIADQVVREGFAILSNDVSGGDEFAGAPSLISPRISSLLCVPLVLFGRTLGAIYLTASDGAARFKEDHLQLVAVISGIAAVALENARHVEWLAGENTRLRADSQLDHDMVGGGPRVRAIYEFIAKVAPTDSTVLIRGESGTGKELAARALHRNSPRRAKPFVAINCAALSETLLESELFGHERGAFTGAVALKHGRLEIADGGTVFLDEIGEMPPPMQAKLLRVLQEREFERVGGTRTIKVDVRVIAATNRNLEDAMRDGQFRQDLFYRLDVVSFEMPPLRERREDIPALAAYFVEKYAAKFNRKVSGLTVEAGGCLMNYDWPGNIRELENTIERAVVLGTTAMILPEDLPEMIAEAEPQASEQQASAPPVTKYHEAMREAKKQLILKAVEEANGSYTEAAKLLGVNPNYLHRLMRNLNLKAMLKKGER